jgi:hypothetical protein
MHANHRHAARGMLTTCPSCLQRAEIVDRFTLPSTSGPASHVRVRCGDGHVYTVLVDDAPSLN